MKMDRSPKIYEAMAGMIAEIVSNAPERARPLEKYVWTPEEIEQIEAASTRVFGPRRKLDSHRRKRR